MKPTPKLARLHMVGSVVPHGTSRGNPAVSQAGNLCQHGVIGGLAAAEIELVQVVSYFPNKLFPSGKKVTFPGLRTKIAETVDFVAVPYLNLPVFRALTVNGRILIHLLRTVSRGDSILFYNVTMPSGLIGLILRAIKGTQCYAMIYDIHVPGQTVPNNLRWQFEYWKHKWLLPKLDGVIAITSDILTDFKCRTKGIIVEGGIAEMPAILAKSSSREAGQTFTIAFAGHLSEYNGLHLVLGAMARIPDPHLRLVIAGDGPLRSTIEAAASTDKRITYRGLLSHDEVLELYQDVQLLLCIRVTKEIHTGYFFPSKLIECLSTGIPLLTTDMTSTNLDVSKYAHIVREETVAGVADAIVEIVCVGNDKLSAKSRDARIFISENMTWRKQCERIARFATGRGSSI